MALSKNAKVAFIGTGIMGTPIAEHLISAGYDVTVYNRTPEKAQKLVSFGAHAAESVADAAKDADVIFTMVGYPTDVEDVYLATDGLIRVAKKGAYLIDLTTSSSQLARDIHDAAEIEGKHAFDCPVTGGQKGAQDGTLFFKKLLERSGNIIDKVDILTRLHSTKSLKNFWRELLCVLHLYKVCSCTTLCAASLQECPGIALYFSVLIVFISAHLEYLLPQGTFRQEHAAALLKARCQ